MGHRFRAGRNDVFLHLGLGPRFSPGATILSLGSRNRFIVAQLGLAADFAVNRGGRPGRSDQL